MPASESDAVAYKLMPFFIARFIANGNVYDPETNTRTKFAAEDIEALEEQYGLDKNQCNAFVRKVYAKHSEESAFRTYIGVPKPGKNVRKTHSSFFHARSIAVRFIFWFRRHVAIFVQNLKLLIMIISQ